MGVLLRLNDVAFDNDDLPSLGSFGRIYTDDLIGSYKLDTSGLLNSAAIGGDLTDVGTATGARLPSWADGVLTVPDAFASTEYNRYSMEGQITATPFTFFALIKPDTSRTFYLLHGCTINLLCSGGGAELQAVFDNGSVQVVPLVAMPGTGTWTLIGVSATDTLMRYALNGGAPAEYLFATSGGAPTGVTAHTPYLGNNDINTGLQGDFAYFAAYDRAMTGAEMTSMAAAIRKLATDKGVTF